MADNWSKVVSSLHVAKLCQSHLGRWRLLHAFLDLDEAVANDIDRENRPEEEKKSNFLQAWKQRKGGEATYRALYNALVEHGDQKDADYLATLVGGKAKKLYTTTVLTYSLTLAAKENIDLNAKFTKKKQTPNYV